MKPTKGHEPRRVRLSIRIMGCIDDRLRSEMEKTGETKSDVVNRVLDKGLKRGT